MERFFADYWLRAFATTPSTQDEAKQYHASGGDKKTLFLSGRQSAGYGRHGRAFLDSGGDKKPVKGEATENFFFSLYLPHFHFLAEALPSIGLLVGICLFDAVANFLPNNDNDAIRLKWPNDLLLHGKKLAGILVEKIDGAVIIGIGANLHHAPAGFACLAELADIVPTPRKLAQEMLQQIDNHLLPWQAEGFAPFASLYTARAMAIDTAIEFTVPGRAEKTSGIYQGITPDGALRVMTDGVVKIFSVADIL
ncbi:MAG: biotin--[acetyl-CoA-carboxylase] ligase [Hydrotalea sp.]|nr:biotin--[acetyl-CoA-carboxylase] ligase [Hydrotalea sp.]